MAEIDRIYSSDIYPVAHSEPVFSPLPAPRAQGSQYGISTVSTIAPSEQRIFLQPKRPHANIVIIQLVLASDEIAKRDLALGKSHISKSRSDLEKFNDKQVEELRVLAVRVDDASMWRSIETGVKYFTGAASTLIGATACANPILATALVVGGAGNIIGQVVIDTRLMEKIGSYFSNDPEAFSKTAGSVIGWTSTAVSLASGAFGAFSGALSPGYDLIEKAVSLASSASGAIASFERTKNDSLVSASDEVLLRIDTARTLSKSTIDQTVSHVEDTVDFSQALVTKTKSALDAWRRAIQKLIQSKGR